ncbi:DnaD domain-containing protein [Natribacillus halophilus]|uniref:DNA replication protein DnaD n=1 Tax=Natribacillus halophilus TaxID=549003 RepID=A0A1G8JAE6_9BACI|nr:DnaD domain-containing protein [Natribacillus halophilus]SDI28061.1 DNA replication protein DnaD [Natribacillus halophilus]
MERDVVIHLLEKGYVSIPVVFLDYYDAFGLDEKDMMLLLHLHRYIQQGHTFPTPEQLAQKMTLTVNSCQQAIGRLLKRGVLRLEQNEDDNGIMFETYSLKPFYEKIVTHLEAEYAPQDDTRDQDAGELYRLFENEFGRPLSPMEGETLAMWVDQDKYTYTLIKAALREAVISGKLNLRYIDAILFEWQKNGIKTPEEANAYSEKFRQKQKKGKDKETSKQSAPPYPNYNWLESD